MMALVQISNGSKRRLAVVEEPLLRCVEGYDSVYELARECARNGASMTETAKRSATGESLDYNAIYRSESEWRLLPPIDVPEDPWRTLVSGTGLTHLGSAKDRQAMHLAEKSASTRAKAEESMTDSMRMFQWGIEGGRPAEGEVGIAPEWFFKGNGSIIQAPFAPLTIPGHAEDGGEEAEVAGVYLIGEDGVPYRIGLTAGNEFADHKFERRNYLNLAGSKLRVCSLGPELLVGAEFGSIAGEVRIERNGETLWRRPIETGEANMAHSLANLEHHHFKFEGHRTPGDVHVHFFGAHSLSFGEGIELQDGDWMEVRYEGFGRPLRNPVRLSSDEANKPVLVKVMV
ncbi:MAG: GguC family protein [Acidobacteriaceae bacterium]